MRKKRRNKNVDYILANGGPIVKEGTTYIPIKTKPLYKNSDGSYSNEVSMSFSDDNGSWIIPTFFDGNVHSADDAIKRFYKTGEHLGAFNNDEDVQRGANLREYMNNLYSPLIGPNKDGKYANGGIAPITQLINAGAILGENLVDNAIPDQKDRINVDGLTGKGFFKGAGMGAQIGTTLLPGIGTVAGTVIGGAAGALIANNKANKAAKINKDNLISQYYYALGGKLLDKDNLMGNQLSEFEGATHEEGGIKLTNNAEVEDGEVKWKDYIFSDRLTLGKDKKTFAQRAKSIKSKYKGRENDSMANEAMEIELNRLMQENEVRRLQEEESANNRKYANGGPNNPPTTADSLALYNNTLAVKDYYEKSGKYLKSRISGDLVKQWKIGSGPFEKALATDLYDFGQLKSTRTPNGDIRLSPDNYFKPLDSNRFYKRESASGILDTRAPMSLYDKRILPTVMGYYDNVDKKDPLYGDNVNIYQYDPIAVKPWHMSTEAEKKIKREKYGQNASNAQTKIEEIKASTKPNITSSTKNVEQKPSVPSFIPKTADRLEPRTPNLNDVNIPKPNYNFEIPPIEPEPKMQKYYLGLDAKNEELRLSGKPYFTRNKRGHIIYIPSGDLKANDPIRGEKDGGKPRVGYLDGEGTVDDFAYGGKLYAGGPFKFTYDNYDKPFPVDAGTFRGSIGNYGGNEPIDFTDLGNYQMLNADNIPSYNKFSSGLFDSNVYNPDGTVKSKVSTPSNSYGNINMPYIGDVMNSDKNFIGNTDFNNLGSYEMLGQRDPKNITSITPKSINTIGSKTANELPQSQLPEGLGDFLNTHSSNNRNSSKFGMPEAALISSNLAAFDNMLKSMSPAVTKFDRLKLDRLNLQEARDLNARNEAQARAVTQSNIRSNATSSGQALSNLATANAALSNNRMNADIGTFLQEKQYNTGVSNQERSANNQISMQEVIANEQNKANAQSVGNLGLANMGLNNQGYFKDKTAIAENLKYNEQLRNLINQMFPNYTFGTDDATDQIIIKFLGGK